MGPPLWAGMWALVVVLTQAHWDRQGLIQGMPLSWVKGLGG